MVPKAPGLLPEAPGLLPEALEMLPEASILLSKSSGLLLEEAKSVCRQKLFLIWSCWVLVYTVLFINVYVSWKM